MSLHQHPHPGPPQGRGHPDFAGKRWWDGDLGRWIPFDAGIDELEVVLEQVTHASTLQRLAAAATGGQFASAYRFVGIGTSDDARWPKFLLATDPFPLTPAQVHQLMNSQSAGIDDSTADERLTELRAELLRCGWEPVGHGAHWWEQRFTRQRLDWPADIVPREPVGT